MLGQPGKGEIRLLCTEQSFPEFPNLLFGTATDTGTTYFDGTTYIQKTAPDKNLRNFFTEYRWPIQALCQSYGIKAEDIYKINEQGHYLIEGSFTYLFIAFVEPPFLGYVFDRIHELFSEGVVYSDTFIAQYARERLTKDILLALAGIDEPSSSNQ